MNTTEKQTAKATRPASRWRNKGRALRTFTYRDGKRVARGQEHWGACEWPSRDTAETSMHHWMSEWPDYVEYLGAFPVDA